INRRRSNRSVGAIHTCIRSQRGRPRIRDHAPEARRFRKGPDTDMTAYAGSQTAASKPRVGFLGAGWIGRMRLKSLVDSGAAQLAAIVDSSPEALAQARQIAPQALPALSADRL